MRLGAASDLPVPAHLLTATQISRCDLRCACLATQNTLLEKCAKYELLEINARLRFGVELAEVSSERLIGRQAGARPGGGGRR